MLASKLEEVIKALVNPIFTLSHPFFNKSLTC